MRRLFSFLMAAVLALSLAACGDRPDTPANPKSSNTAKTQITGSLLEVAPPPVIQQLSQSLAVYQPQVSIISPQSDEVLQDTTVTAQLQVQDLPIFQDETLGMGPHLEVILDNNPYTMVYDLKQPLVFPDLAPGTHTLRVIAATPWHESFKNDGAYAQTTFHIFTKTTDNNPDPALPLLTYSRPTGSYGAEPILLDFYLTNAPLHLVAQENPDDNIADWRIRATVNGQSFILDRWQSVYLKGFKPGKNWVQLEFLDEQGNPLKNVFNNTVRLIDYQPRGKDTLSKLVRGEISAVAARGIVEPAYKAEPTPEVIPPVEETPSPEEASEAIPPVEETPSLPEETPEAIPPVEETPNLPEAEPTPAPSEVQPKEQPKSGGFFGRFRRQPEKVTPSPELVVPEEPKVIETPEQVPAEEELPTTSETKAPAEEELPTTSEQEVQPQAQPKSGGFFGRFRRQPETPKALPKLPEELEVPSPEPTLPEIVPPEALKTPSEEPVTPVTPAPEVEPPTQPEPQETPSQEATETPKINLKELLTAPAPPPKIIQAPTVEEEIPERFLKKAEPDVESKEIPEASEAEQNTSSEQLETPEAQPNRALE